MSVPSKQIQLHINGKKLALESDPDRPLLFVLREDLDLTGSKYGCGEGQCGACTVLIDGRASRSCITPIGAVEGKQVTTIEGLEHGGKLHPLQEAFLEVDSMQCGYCTAGMIMSAAGLLAKTPHASETEIVHAMQGNVCRCGTYNRIVAAIRKCTGARTEVSR